MNGETIRNGETISMLLDMSCGKALSAWFRDRTYCPNTAFNVLKALPLELGGNKMPNYNCFYVPPAYVIQYQIGHIYMAWKALYGLSKKSWTHYGHVRIVDFGAGAATARIGAALMVAQAIEDGIQFDRVSIVEVEPSVLMQEMGDLIWETFVQEVRAGFAGTSLSDSVQIVEYTQNKSWKEIPRQGGNTWLTAFHAIYPGIYDMKTEIDGIYSHVNPDMGVFSCHSWKLDDLKKVFPFDIISEWNAGYFPKHIDKPGGRVTCQTTYVSSEAERLGFRRANVTPFMQVRKCALLYGREIPF